MLKESQMESSEIPSAAHNTNDNYDFLAQIKQNDESMDLDQKLSDIKNKVGIQNKGDGTTPQKMQRYSDLSSSEDDEDDAKDERDKERERILQEKLKFYREKYGGGMQRASGSSA